MINALAMMQQPVPQITMEEVVDNAMNRMEQENGVIVQYVPKTNKFMIQGGQTRNALAARDPEGGEWILINQDAVGADLKPQTEHEVAHILAWRKYGENIKPHGPQFLKMCRQVVTERQNEFCRRGQ
jgi:hypothetical protein